MHSTICNFSFVDTSNFQVLIGDVELGQDIPGLLDVAAGDGDRVRVFVTDEIQTATATEGAYILLDWFRWVTETLGDSAVNASYTLRRTQLSESGVPLGPAQVVNASDDRIEIEFESDENEFYVKISRVVARAGAEDPDRAIYDLEACVPQPDGSERCYRSNITVYAIDTTPPLGMESNVSNNTLHILSSFNFLLIAELVCGTSGFGGMITISCVSNNPLISPQRCTPQPLEVLITCKFCFFCNLCMHGTSTVLCKHGSSCLAMEFSTPDFGGARGNSG